MFDAKTLQWLEKRINLCQRCYKLDFCAVGKKHNFTTTSCRFWEPVAINNVIGCINYDYRDAAEFEARVAVHLAGHGVEDVPCAHGMVFFCPNPPFMGNDCVKWCRLRDARLAVEREMLAEGKGPVRKE